MLHIFRRQLRAGAVLGALATLATSAIVAAPAAQAADPVRYLRNDWTQTWVYSTGAGNRARMTGTSGATANKAWRYQYRFTLNGHPVVRLQNLWNNSCLDTNGTTSQVWTLGCNTGGYQLWEVFTNSDGSTTYKSYGAYIFSSRHVCMAPNQLLRTTLDLVACNTNASAQQWRSVA
jgi:hypothetical protein